MQVIGIKIGMNFKCYSFLILFMQQTYTKIEGKNINARIIEMNKK